MSFNQIDAVFAVAFSCKLNSKGESFTEWRPQPLSRGFEASIVDCCAIPRCSLAARASLSFADARHHATHNLASGVVPHTAIYNSPWLSHDSVRPSRRWTNNMETLNVGYHPLALGTRQHWHAALAWGSSAKRLRPFNVLSCRPSPLVIFPLAALFLPFRRDGPAAGRFAELEH